MIEINNGIKTFSYGNKTIRALNMVNLKINTKELVAIVGSSGSGKSTLLNIIAGYDFLDRGEYYFCGKDIKDIDSDQFHKEKVGIIFQDYQLMEELSVLDNILLGCYYAKKKLDKQLLKETINELNLKNLLEKQVNYLSGGEKQRVAIARILIANKPILLADEPTGALDQKNAVIIMNLLRKLVTQGKTVIVVTHDQTVANKCDRIIRLENGYASETDYRA